MKAKIIYHSGKGRISSEGYEIRIQGADGEWGMDKFFPLVRRENADADEEKNFIHFSFLNEIANLQAFGYKINLDIQNCDGE